MNQQCFEPRCGSGQHPIIQDLCRSENSFLTSSWASKLKKEQNRVDQVVILIWKIYFASILDTSLVPLAVLCRTGNGVIPIQLIQKTIPELDWGKLNSIDKENEQAGAELGQAQPNQSWDLASPGKIIKNLGLNVFDETLSI